MAIWDEAVAKAEEEELKKATAPLGKGSTGSQKCPGCADTLFFDANFGKLACRSCGNVYDPSTMALNGTFSVGDRKVSSEENADKVEYVCDSCGATILSNIETAATFCAHCGSPTLLKRRLQHEFAPDLIIPFSITKEDAIKRYKEWMKKQKMRPSDFGLNFNIEESIMGIYVPFWLIDADVEGNLSASGKQLSYNGYMKYYVDRECKFGLRRVPFDGSKVIDNFLMRALEPFDYSKLQYYSDNFLPGFYAERYTETPFDMTDIIRHRLDNYGAEAGKHMVGNDYDVVDDVRMSGFSSNYKCAYAMFPVWFINYKYQGVTYQFGVNGESGEVGGDVPISDGYRRMQIFKALASDIPLYIIALVIILFNLFGLVTMVSDVFLYGLFIGAALLIAMISISAYKLKWITFEQTSSLDVPPPVEEYVDNKASSYMKKHDYVVGFINCDQDELRAMKSAASAEKFAKTKGISTLEVLAKLWRKGIGR